jgi:DNA-binding response OmpR family regulator
MDKPSKRILLAEDDRFLRRAAETTLKRHGFTVLTASDGVDALRVARAEMPGLVLLDLIMPKLQGFRGAAHAQARPPSKGFSASRCN